MTAQHRMAQARAGAPVPLNTPLHDAKQWLLDRVDEGAACPCCTQYAKVYRRKISRNQARALLLVYRAARTDWCHVTRVDPTLAGNGGDISKLRHWGLIEEQRERAEDGNRAGVWRITPLGEQFVLGKTTVPKYGRFYDGRCLSFDLSEHVDIYEALTEKFNYDDMMRGI